MVIHKSEWLLLFWLVVINETLTHHQQQPRPPYLRL